LVKELVLLFQLAPYIPMTTCTSRIQLINKFKPLLLSKKKPLEKRISNSGISLVINSISLIVLLGYGYISILMELIGIQDIFIWNKTGLIVILFIINSLNFQKNVYEYLLLKHLHFLNQNSDHFIEWEINDNLQKIINQLNNPFPSKIAIVSAVIFLILTTLNYVINTNFEYGNYFKIPFVVYTLYFFNLFWSNYKQLIQNLIHVEIN
jgi:hypothetical protein